MNVQYRTWRDVTASGFFNGKTGVDFGAYPANELGASATAEMGVCGIALRFLPATWRYLKTNDRFDKRRLRSLAESGGPHRSGTRVSPHNERRFIDMPALSGQERHA